MEKQINEKKVLMRQGYTPKLYSSHKKIRKD